MADPAELIADIICEGRAPTRCDIVLEGKLEKLNEQHA